MLLDNDLAAVLGFQQMHVGGWPPFLPLLLERLGLNPFGGSCEGGWDEFADVRFTCSCNS